MYVLTVPELSWGTECCLSCVYLPSCVPSLPCAINPMCCFNGVYPMCCVCMSTVHVMVNMWRTTRDLTYVPSVTCLVLCANGLRADLFAVCPVCCLLYRKLKGLSVCCSSVFCYVPILLSVCHMSRLLSRRRQFLCCPSLAPSVQWAVCLPSVQCAVCVSAVCLCAVRSFRCLWAVRNLLIYWQTVPALSMCRLFLRLYVKPVLYAAYYACCMCAICLMCQIF